MFIVSGMKKEQGSGGATPRMAADVPPLQGFVPSKRVGYKHSAPLELNSDIKSLTKWPWGWGEYSSHSLGSSRALAPVP